MSDCSVNGVATLSCIFPIITSLLFWALTSAGTVALFMIIIAGYRFLFSGGDSKAVDGARKTLTYTVIGLVIIFLSFFILNLIAGITGVNCLSNIARGNFSFTVCQ